VLPICEESLANGFRVVVFFARHDMQASHIKLDAMSAMKARCQCGVEVVSEAAPIAYVEQSATLID
jgi:hypothetical protein